MRAGILFFFNNYWLNRRTRLKHFELLLHDLFMTYFQPVIRDSRALPNLC